MKNGADAYPPCAAIPISGPWTSRLGTGGVDFACLVHDVSLVASVPTAAVPALVAQAAAEQSRIAALQCALAARLVGGGTSVSTTTEKLLNVHEAADLLGLSVDWLYRHAKGLPFTRRVGRALRFDRVGVARWLAAQRKG